MLLQTLILNYLQQPETDFAILIDGAWGSGKTYFLKTTMTDEVKKILYLPPVDEEVQGNESEEKKGKPYELVYVSLYGATSVDELEKRLLMAINPFLKSKAFILGSSVLNKVAGIFKVKLERDDVFTAVNIFGGIPKNKILVFDDLERLGENTLNEILGFINAYTEHQNLKVIIVADQDKIKEKLKDYDNVKEKLVRFTYKFNPSLTEVFNTFLQKYISKSYSAYLHGQKIALCDLFEKGKHQNLRSLRFVLDIFEKVYETVQHNSELEDESKKIILSRYLYFITTYSIELKKGVNDNFLNHLKDLSSNLQFPSSHFFDPSRVAKKDEQLPPSEIEEYKKYFRSTYNDSHESQFEYYDFLVDYIKSGSLDKKVVNEKNKESNDILIRRKGTPHHIALDKLHNILSLADDEFQPLVEEIFSYVEEGKYTFQEYFNLFYELIRCEHYKIGNFKMQPNAIERFKQGMVSSSNSAKYDPTLQSAVEEIGSTHKTLNIIANLALELNDHLRFTDDKNLADKFINLILPESLSELYRYAGSNDIRQTPIFQEKYIHPTKLLDSFIKLPNSSKQEFNRIMNVLSMRLEKTLIELRFELPFFEKFDSLIDQQILTDEKTGRKISTELLYRLKSRTTNLIGKLKEQQARMITRK